jgi:hypothetical protein
MSLTSDRNAFAAPLLALLAAVLALLPPVGAPPRAHEIRPAVATLSIAAGDGYELKLVANLEAMLAGIGAEHTDSTAAPGGRLYAELRPLAPDALRRRFEAFAPTLLERLEIAFDGARSVPRLVSVSVPAVGDLALARISTVVLEGAIPAGARTLRWSYPPALGSSVLRIVRPGAAEPEALLLSDGATSEPIPLETGPARHWLATAWDYLALGFTHILPKGLDHILFVLGLYLLSTEWRPLLVQVTAFTIAHSLTLALGLYGIVDVPAAIVEPLIALSIVYVAVENLVTSRLTPWRPFVVFAFGLLHGLGFAGILQEIGLPRADYVLALVSFNVGVELGQLAVIALAFVATGLWFRNRSWYRARVVVPASLAIAAAGLFWTLERVLAAG